VRKSEKTTTTGKKDKRSAWEVEKRDRGIGTTVRSIMGGPEQCWVPEGGKEKKDGGQGKELKSWKKESSIRSERGRGG